MKKLLSIIFIAFGANFVFAQNVNEDLFKAAGDDDIEAVKAAITKGAEKNYLNEDGETSIMAAVDADSKDVVEYLLTIQGINCNVVDSDNKNVLHHMSGSKNLITFLPGFIRQGASINGVDKDGDTPLMRAVNKDNLELVKSLILNGADILIKNDDETAFDMALSVSDEVLKVFVDTDVNGKIDKKMATDLICESRTLFALKKAIAMGVDLNTDCGKADLILIQAIQKEDTMFVEALAKNNVNLNCRNSNGTPALFLCTNPYILNILLKNKADKNILDNNLYDSNKKTIFQFFIDNIRYNSFKTVTKKTAVDQIKVLVDNGYVIPKTLSNKAVLQYIDELEFSPSSGKSKVNFDMEKEALKAYLKTKGVK